MTNPSPLVLINSQSQLPNGVNVTAGSTVTVALASSQGVYAWSLQCIGTDDLNSTAAVNATLVINAAAKTATFTMPSLVDGYGSALIFKSIVNNGIDINGLVQPYLTTTFGVYVLVAGLRLGAQNETVEGNAIYGWLTKYNDAVRGGAFSGGLLFGDVTGGAADNTISFIQGIPVSAASPTTGEVLEFNGTTWVAAAGGGVLAGDVTGPAGSNTVINIHGVSVPATPSANQVLVATSPTSSTWEQIANAQVASGAAIAYSKLNLTGDIVNADINSSAAITYSKLNLTGDIVNADLSSSAAIAVSKLAAGTAAQFLLNSSTPTPTWTSMSGDISLTSTGATKILAIDGYSIAAPGPTSGQILEYNGTNIVWVTPAGTITWANDLSTSTNTDQYVSSITGSGGVVSVSASIQGSSSGSGTPLSYSIGNVVMPSDANLTLSAAQMANPILRVTSTPSLTATRNIVLPATTGALYKVFNNTTGGQSLQFIASSGTGVTVPNGLKAEIYFDGTNYVPALTVIGGDLSATGNTSQKVVGIDGYALSGSGPTSGQILEYNGTNLVWSTPSSGVTWNGDLTSSSNIIQYVSAISGSSGSGGNVPINATSLSFASGQSAPFFEQTGFPSVSSGGTLSGQALTLQSQPGQTTTQYEGYGGYGGNLILAAGAGGAAVNGTPGIAGNVAIYNGPTQSAIFGPSNIKFIQLAGYGAGYVSVSNSGILGFSSGPTPSGSAGGDLSGTYPNPSVAAIQGNPVSATGATHGQFLVENSGATGSAWTSISGDISASVSTVGKLTVTGIQGNTFTSGAPTKGQFVVATSTSNYGPVTLSGDISESASTAGLLTVVGVDGYAFSGAGPTSGQYLEYNGSNLVWATPASSITWANDLSSSSATHQYVSSISGTSGTGTTCTLNVNQMTFASGLTGGVALDIASMANQTGADDSGNAGQNIYLIAQPGQNATGTPTANGGNGGNAYVTSGIAGTSSTGAAGTSGSVILAIGGSSSSGGGTAGLTLKPTGVVTIANLSTGLVHADSSGNLTSSLLVNADVSSSAAIAVSKLAAGSANQVLINSATPTPTWTTLSGDITNSLGALTVNSIQGVVISGTPATGNVLTATSSTAADWAAPANQVTWANDLTSSTNTDQYVTAISGTSGTGTTCTLNVKQMTFASGLIGGVALDIASMAFTSSGSGAAGNDVYMISQPGQAATGASHNGGNGGNAHITSGLGGTSGSATPGTSGSVILAIGGSSGNGNGTPGLTLNPTGVVTIANLGTGLVHADSSGNLTSSLLVNADISASAAIAVSKIAAGTSAQILMSNGTPATTWTSMSGDVTIGATGATTVGAIQGQTVTSGALTKGQFFVASSTSNWAATTLSGDISESATTAGQLTIVAIDGYTIATPGPVSGQVLEYNGTNLAWTTSSSAPSGSAGGALSGTYPNPTISLTSNASITGLLPVTNLAYGTSAQILMSNGTPATTWTSMSGDVTIGNSGATTVNSIQGNPIESGTLGALQDGYVLTWVNGSTQWQARGINEEYEIHTVNASYQINSTQNDYHIFVATHGITLTLPKPALGVTFEIWDETGTLTLQNSVSANAVVIAQYSTESIGGLATSYLFQTNYGHIKITCSDGTNWQVG